MGSQNLMLRFKRRMIQNVGASHKGGAQISREEQNLAEDEKQALNGSSGRRKNHMAERDTK